jgi:toxin ParE1/3/4
MNPAVFRRAARSDYAAAVRWYEKGRTGLGAELVLEVRRTLLAASEYPDRAPVVEANIRRIKTNRFPFYIFYRTRGAQLVVLAVFHSRRNPAVWRKRL